jgi:hypothetical protein
MEEFDCLVVYVPAPDADALRSALAAAGAGRLGNYAGCSFSVDGMGRFTPLQGSSPAIGTVGEPEQVPETRIEAIYPRGQRNRIVSALIAAHPYETPAFMTFPVDISLPPEA